VTKDAVFGSIMQEANAFDVTQDAELAGSYPGASHSKNRLGANAVNYRVKYGRFAIDEDGNPDLEEIMEDITRGDKKLCWERVTDTKDGDTFITIKYMIVEKKTDILGNRRIRKAELKRVEEDK